MKELLQNIEPIMQGIVGHQMKETISQEELSANKIKAYEMDWFYNYSHSFEFQNLFFYKDSALTWKPIVESCLKYKLDDKHVSIFAKKKTKDWMHQLQEIESDQHQTETKVKKKKRKKKKQTHRNRNHNQSQLDDEASDRHSPRLRTPSVHPSEEDEQHEEAPVQGDASRDNNDNVYDNDYDNDNDDPWNLDDQAMASPRSENVQSDGDLDPSDEDEEKTYHDDDDEDDDDEDGEDEDDEADDDEDDVQEAQQSKRRKKPISQPLSPTTRSKRNRRVREPDRRENIFAVSISELSDWALSMISKQEVKRVKKLIIATRQKPRYKSGKFNKKAAIVEWKFRCHPTILYDGIIREDDYQEPPLDDDKYEEMLEWKKNHLKESPKKDPIRSQKKGCIRGCLYYVNGFHNIVCATTNTKGRKDAAFFCPLHGTKHCPAGKSTLKPANFGGHIWYHVARGHLTGVEWSRVPAQGGYCSNCGRESTVGYTRCKMRSSWDVHLRRCPAKETSVPLPLKEQNYLMPKWMWEWYRETEKPLSNAIKIHNANTNAYRSYISYMESKTKPKKKRIKNKKKSYHRSRHRRSTDDDGESDESEDSRSSSRKRRRKKTREAKRDTSRRKKASKRPKRKKRKKSGDFTSSSNADTSSTFESSGREKNRKRKRKRRKENDYDDRDSSEKSTSSSEEHFQTTNNRHTLRNNK